MIAILAKNKIEKKQMNTYEVIKRSEETFKNLIIYNANKKIDKFIL